MGNRLGGHPVFCSVDHTGHNGNELTNFYFQCFGILSRNRTLFPEEFEPALRLIRFLGAAAEL